VLLPDELQQVGRPDAGLLAGFDFDFGFGSVVAWPVTWASILSCSCCRCWAAVPKEPNKFSRFAIFSISFCSKRLTPVNTRKT